jgi:hypothetical protein
VEWSGVERGEWRREEWSGDGRGAGEGMRGEEEKRVKGEVGSG